MSLTPVIIGKVNSGSSVYEVAIRYEFTQNVPSLKTHALICLSVRRTQQSTSSSSYSDVFPWSVIWDKTRKSSVTIPTTTEWRDIIYKEDDLQHDQNGIYNNGNGLNITYKWGSFYKAINGSKTINVPDIRTSEKVISCGQLTYNQNNSGLQISSYSKGLYSCKLYVSYDNSTYDYAGYEWSINDRSEIYPRLTPSLSVFQYQDYCNIWFKVYTYNSEQTLIAQSEAYRTRLFAGTSLNPELSVTFAPYRSGQLDIDDVCGEGFAEANVIPGISSYRMTATATAKAGLTISRYQYYQFTQGTSTYDETSSTSNVHDFIRTIHNDFGCYAVDSNGRQSVARGPATLNAVPYFLPRVTVDNIYLNASNQLVMSGQRQVKQATIGELENKGYIMGQYKRAGQVSWSPLFEQETFTSNGAWTKTINNITTDYTYTVRILVWDGLFQCRSTSGDGQYTIYECKNVGLKPVLEMDNTAINLYKNTTVAGTLHTTGNITSSVNISANGALASNYGKDILADDELSLNGLSALLFSDNVLSVGEDANVTNFGKNNRFQQAPSIMSENTPNSIDASLSQSGYTRLSNGVLIQWYRAFITCGDNGVATVTMPYPIKPTSAFWGIGCTSYTYGHGMYKMTVDSVSANAQGGEANVRLVDTRDGSTAPSGTQVYGYILWIGR